MSPLDLMLWALAVCLAAVAVFCALFAIVAVLGTVAGVTISGWLALRDKRGRK
ncbi:hypothetical protein OA2633_00040 [Oceanicaulis alexandrii HTCC2633]|uniref:hypothetical protein n=1 Tax=Oceanicaulis sp. HTCC2633 TaxID=314254 RepID=UPI0000668C83|nr:hypothetical protein [Oceanicaulis sp. HTCC2633]EAP88633.1 hypothetical protein OA2633_00040 [Oceanicaulis alexandrii HTCC2633] [Oceanicaulis sp. HTCC2633]